jgi:hypothetical protein
MPDTGDTNIPLNSAIFIQFSEVMSGSSLTSNNGSTGCTGSVQLKAQGAANCVPLNFITNDNLDNYTVNPVSPLNASTVYEVLVTNDALNQVNIPMWDDYTWSFTTAASLASFEDNKDKVYGKGMRCTSAMEVNENKGKKVKVSWRKNREKLVNSLGGGYEVFYKKGNEFYCKKIRYTDGEWAPNETSLNLTSGRWYLRVKGYSRLNKDGSAFSKVITLDIP